MPVALFGGASIDPYVDYNWFTIPHPGSTPYPWLERWTETDHQIQDLGHLGQGILYGCHVRAFDSVAYKVRVSSGQVTLRGATASLAMCEAIPNPPHGTLPRIDVVGYHILSSGAAHIQMIAGTPSSNPYPPLLPSGYDAAAFVFIPASCKAIYPNQIVSKRILVTTAPATHNYSVLAGHASDTAIGMGTTVYGGFVGRFTPGGTETDFQIIIPRAGTLSQLSIVTAGANTNANLVATLRKNAADTALVVTVADGQAAGVYTDSTHTVTVAAGDKLSLKLAETGGVANSAALRGVSLLYDAP